MLVKSEKIITEAFNGSYAIAAIDVFDVASVRGVLKAAVEKRSPVILQFMQDVILHLGARTAYGLVEGATQEIDVPVVLHLDHGYDMDVIQDCIEAGFSSVMVDASSKPYEENVRISREVAEYAHGRGVWVEAGLGPVYALPEMALEQGDMTDPEQVVSFIEETGADALAVAVGTVHGAFTGQEYLRFELIEAIEKKAPDLPLVIHGASGVADKHIRQAVGTNVVKVSVGTEVIHGYREAVAAWLAAEESGLGMVSFLQRVEERVALVAADKIELLGSSGSV